MFLSPIYPLENFDDETMPYKGRRNELRKEVEVFPEKIRELEDLTSLMTCTKMHLGFLWKVKDESSKNKIYLFGTSHRSTVDCIFPQEFIHPKVYKKFIKGQDLYVEFNMCNLNSEERNKLNNAKAAEATLNKTRKVFLSKAIKRTYKHYVSRSLGLDSALIALAAAYNIKIHSLETYEIQEKLLTDVSKMDFPYAGEEALDVIDLIQSGNFEQYENMYNSQSSEFKQLVEDRNPRMADIISEKLKNKESGFFAIGAAHFAGEKGILSLLKDYKIKRIDLNPNDNTPIFSPYMLHAVEL